MFISYLVILLVAGSFLYWLWEVRTPEDFWETQIKKRFPDGISVELIYDISTCYKEPESLPKSDAISVEAHGGKLFRVLKRNELAGEGIVLMEGSYVDESLMIMGLSLDCWYKTWSELRNNMGYRYSSPFLHMTEEMFEEKERKEKISNELFSKYFHYEQHLIGAKDKINFQEKYGRI